MNVRIQRERDAQFERERAVVEMRQAVVSAVAPAYVRRVGSAAVFEAVDEALAQIVAAGDHLGEAEQVKALWITCARRRLIDQQRSAEARHRDAAADDAVHALADNLCGDLSQLTEDGRQRWRIREILSVLRGDQRRWAEAWFDEILSAQSSGAQPRGLPETLGWSPSKTKSVSRRARLKMAAFIDQRVSGAVCEEQREWLDAFILTGSRQHPGELDGERYAAVLFHVAGCDDCWAAWHTRRRTLLGRCRTSLLVPLDAFAMAAHGIGDRISGLAVGAQGQAASLLARMGIGGAAAAGGGAATLGGKAAVVCVGVVCAATAGGELAGVLPTIAPETAGLKHAREARAKPARAPTVAATNAARQAASKVSAPAVTPTPASKATDGKAAARAALAAAKRTLAPVTPGDLPPADPSASKPPPPPPAAPPPAAAQPSASFSTSNSGAPLTPPPAASSARSTSPTCVPGDLGC